MTYMNKQLLYLTGILVLMLAASLAVPAQESSDSLNSTINNSTLQNNTTVNDTAPAAAVSSGSPVPLGDNGASSGSAQNLSTVNGRQISSLPISQMAGAAPLVAAGASSAQVAGEQSNSYKIGEVAGGIDIFNPEHVEVEPLTLGIETKPIRDVGKMFFVCDIV
jgi:hypothetical protein